MLNFWSLERDFVGLEEVSFNLTLSLFSLSAAEVTVAIRVATSVRVLALSLYTFIFLESDRCGSSRCSSSESTSFQYCEAIISRGNTDNIAHQVHTCKSYAPISEKYDHPKV
ncbi:hypothetical protein Droror1_Dr00009247 [Drosera rotundifolia]